jgi:hypothetical protein
MKYPRIKPAGWPCELRECPPGHFMLGNQLGFKSEYYHKDQITPQIFCESGEFMRSEFLEKEVTPVAIEWVEIDRDEVPE